MRYSADRGRRSAMSSRPHPGARALPGWGLRAWLVTGPLGRGFAFAIDFAVALRTMLAQRL